MLAGGVNLVREPLNGRNFEYAGEYPLLAGLVIAVLVLGIQSNRIVSTVKHFAINAQETGWHVISAQIGEAVPTGERRAATSIAWATAWHRSGKVSRYTQPTGL